MKFRMVFSLLLMFAVSSAFAVPLTDSHYKVKWSQTADMDQGIDYLSMHRSNGPVVADDFQSNGMPIVGFHWWGSYFQDAGQDPTAERQVSFEISFHPDCPVGSAGPGCDPGLNYSQPGQPYQFQIVSAEEDYYGQTAGGVDIYEYWALLDTPWEEIAGETYWVDIAWDEGQLLTDPTGQPIDTNGDIWGWHESDQHWNDAAVQTNPPSPGSNPHLGPWNPLLHTDGSNVDMAFEVITVPEPDSLALVMLGALGLLMGRRRQSKMMAA